MIIVGVGLDYGLQVYDNYKNEKLGYEAWIGNIDFVDISLSIINPTGKFKIAKTLLLEGRKTPVNTIKNMQKK